MTSCSHFGKMALAFCLAAFGARPVAAAIIAPGQSVPLSGISTASDASLNGTVTAQSDVVFPALLLGDGPVLFSAELRSTVVRETATGTLDFYYQVINNNADAGIQFVGHVTSSSYAGLGADVDYRTDEGGQFFPQSAFRDPSGSAIEFSGFTADLSGGDFSALAKTAPFFVRTDATNFSSEGTAFVQFEDTDVNGPPLPGYATVTTFAPLAAPEPSSAVLTLLGAAIAVVSLGKKTGEFAIGKNRSMRPTCSKGYRPMRDRNDFEYHRISVSVACACAALTALGQSVTLRATTLVPGDQQVPVETIPSNDPSLAGGALIDETVSPSSASDSSYVYPTVTFRAVQRTDAGTLDFYYLIGSGTGANSYFTVDGFAGASTDVFEAQTPSSPPIFGSAASRTGGQGDGLALFTPLGSPGTFFVVRTTSTILPETQTLTYVQGNDTGGTGTLTSTYQLVVPEPATASLLLVGAAALAFRARRLTD